MEETPDYLESISRKLTPHLPASVQAYNSVMLARSGDGIEKRVVSSPDHISVLVLNREDPGRLIVSMFSASEDDGDLRNLLEENIDWNEEIEFVVSLIVKRMVLIEVNFRVSMRDISDLLKVWLHIILLYQVHGFMKT